MDRQRQGGERGPPSYILADSDAALREALGALAGLEVVGVDVERADWRRYYRSAALIQLGGGGRAVLVDPLAIPDLTAVQEFLVGRTVVLHALENDLEPLRGAGIRPRQVQDSAIAAAVLGLPTGLDSLLRDLLGLELTADKAAMQRAEWERRPLSGDMLAYAAADVAELPALWALLRERLVRSGRDDWYRQELAAGLALPPVEVRRTWTRTKGAGRLNATARARLRALWDTRERLARSTDTAPARIVGDKALVGLATSPPVSSADLGRRGLRRQAVRRFGYELLAAVAAGDAAAPEPAREEGRRRAPTDADRMLEERLRAVRAERARRLGIDPGLLCPSRTLMAALLTDPGSPTALREALGLRPWQWQQLGTAFCDTLGLGGPGKPVATDDRRQEPHMADVLNPDALHYELDRLHGWSGTTEGISKTYHFTDFAQSIRFVNRVAELAEQVNHHPDIHVSWDTVRLRLVTHSAGGVTQSDVELAHRLDSP